MRPITDEDRNIEADKNERWLVRSLESEAIPQFILTLQELRKQLIDPRSPTNQKPPGNRYILDELRHT